MRSFLPAILALSLLLLGGCAARSRCCTPRPRCCPPAGARVPRTAPEATPMKTPKPAPTHRLYSAASGKPTTIEAAAAEWKNADLIAFGELHGNLVGAEHQLALLEALAAQERPVALAMEFFERDTQADLDAYLAGDLDEETFRARTKRNAAYAATHGPLVAFCKEQGIPVIAANAPRALVTGYRKADLDYADYLESLTEEERALLPEDTDVLEDEYREKFMQLMGEARGANFFKSQALWDDSMAESMVDFLAEHPDHRVLFIVGGFHVGSGLGTITKYRNRRGKDEVRILLMEMSKDPALAPDDAEMGTADVILKVPAPKPRPMPTKGHPKVSPHKKPGAESAS